MCKWLFAIVPALAACGSSPSEAPSDEQQVQPGETGGTARAADAAVNARAAGGAGRATDGGAGQGTGGKAGGGAGGSASDAAPVAPCSGLGAVDTWETVTPAQAGASMVLSVVIDPLDHSTVYSTIANKGIYKSTDCGASWTKINTGRNGAMLDGGGQWCFVIDPVDSKVMYTSDLPPIAGGADLRLHKSTNGGTDWDPVFERGSEGDMYAEISSIDTANHQHVVLNFHENCKAPHNAMCLAESYDAGASWTIIDGPPSMTGWVEDAGPVVIDDAIYLGVPFNGLFHTANHGVTWTKLSHEGYFHIHKATNGYYYMGGAQTKLQRSKDLQTWTELDNTPWTVSNAIVGDGRRLFAAGRAFVEYVTSPEADGAIWTKMTGPTTKDGAKMFAYDSVNHVLYSANQASGLFRMVTY